MRKRVERSLTTLGELNRQRKERRRRYSKIFWIALLVCSGLLCYGQVFAAAIRGTF
jgi:cell division septal protein FtsQ